MEVELGDQELLEVGEVFQIVRTIEPDGRTGVPTFERDMLGFRLRSERAAAPCNVVSSGLFYAEPTTRTPTVVSLIPGAGPSPGGGRKEGR